MIEYLVLFGYMAIMLGGVYLLNSISKEVARNILMTPLHGLGLGFIIGYVFIPVMAFVFTGNTGDYDAGHYSLSIIIGFFGAMIYGGIEEVINRDR